MGLFKIFYRMLLTHKTFFFFTHKTLYVSMFMDNFKIKKIKKHPYRIYCKMMLVRLSNDIRDLILIKESRAQNSIICSVILILNKYVFN